MEYVITDDLDFNTWLTIQRSSHAVLKIRERELDKLNISATNAAVLLLVESAANTITTAEISQQLLRDPHSISELLTRMEKNGLVSKNKDLPRKNMKRIAMTEKGYEVLHQSSERESIHQAMSVFSDEEKRQLISYLNRLLKKVVEELL